MKPKQTTAVQGSHDTAGFSHFFRNQKAVVNKKSLFLNREKKWKRKQEIDIVPPSQTTRTS